MIRQSLPGRTKMAKKCQKQYHGGGELVLTFSDWGKTYRAPYLRHARSNGAN